MSKCLGERERWVCIGKEREGERESWFVAKGMFGIGRRLLSDRFWRRSCGISLEQLHLQSPINRPIWSHCCQGLELLQC